MLGVKETELEGQQWQLGLLLHIASVVLQPHFRRVSKYVYNHLFAPIFLHHVSEL